MKPSSEQVKVQPPLLAIFFIALAFVFGLLKPLPITVSPALRWAGLGLAALGFLLGLAALMAFRQARQRSARPVLVTTGVYGLSRNPIALGFVLMLAGLPLNAGSLWGIVLSPALIILFNLLVIQPEERFLTRHSGKEYEVYKNRVRRWL